MAWVWKISDSVRVKYPEGLPIVVEFQPELVHCYSQHIEGQGYYADARTVYLKPDERFSVQISLPWPPKNVLQ